MPHARGLAGFVPGQAGASVIAAAETESLRDTAQGLKDLSKAIEGLPEGLNSQLGLTKGAFAGGAGCGLVGGIVLTVLAQKLFRRTST